MRLSPVDIDYLRAVVERHSGNRIDDSRDYLFESRLQQVLRSRDFSSFAELLAALRSGHSASLPQVVAQAMLVNETSFFRESPAFGLLRTDLFPALIAARRSTRRLRLWSAACSSGQEVWSLAMMLREDFPQLAGWNIDILGTDLSSEMIERANGARYSESEVARGLPLRMLQRYFIRRGEEWEVSPEIRRLCHFQQRNLCAVPIWQETFDLILLRNVLLYFPQEARHRILLAMHRSLAPDGALLLGLSENSAMETHWQTVLTPAAVWYRPLASRPTRQPGSSAESLTESHTSRSLRDILKQA